MVNSQFRTREFHRKGLRERIVGLPLLPPLPTLSTQAEFSQNINHHQHLRQTRQSMAEKKYKKRVIQESSSSSSDEGVPLVSPSLPLRTTLGSNSLPLPHPPYPRRASPRPRATTTSTPLHLTRLGALGPAPTSPPQLLTFFPFRPADQTTQVRTRCRSCPRPRRFRCPRQIGRAHV